MALIVEPIEKGQQIIETGATNGDYESPSVPTDPGAGIELRTDDGGKPPPEPKTEPKGDPEEAKLASSWAALKRTEREIWKREKALKDAGGLPDFSNPKAAMEALAAKGITLDHLIDAHLDSSELQSKPEREVDPDVADLKRWKQERIEAEQQAAARASYESGVSALTEGMKEHGERFELLLTEGAHDRVFAKIREHVQEYGKPPDWTEAADAVEAELQAEYEQRLERALGTKKFQSKYARAGQQQTANGNAAKPPRRTITNESVTRGRSEMAEELPLDPDARDRALRKRFSMR